MDDYTWKDKNIDLKEVKYMKYTMLGNSDLKVSKVCLGCMGFGDATKGMHSWTLPEDKSREIIKYALDNGINFLIQRWLIREEQVKNF